MKNNFKEFYEYSDDELKKIWKEAIFIFDTNILNSLYRIPEDLRKDLFKILDQLKNDDRIWVPHQVLFEFHKNRRNVIIGLEKDYKDAIHAIEGFSSELPKKFKGKLKSACENHPLLNSDEIYGKVEKSLVSIKDEIEKIKKTHPDWKNNDEILLKIEKYFSNFGKEYSEKELSEIYKEGEKRYKEHIPPGYADCKNNGGEKEGNNRFGDLIIWKQILDFSKKSKNPIIFITNDIKPDWWVIEYDKPVKPRFELRKEIFKNFKHEFDMYNLEMFLEKSKTYLKSDITRASIDKIRMIRELEERRRKISHRRMMMEESRLNPVFFEKYLMEYIHLFEKIEEIFREIIDSNIHPRHREDLDHLFHRLRRHKDQIAHGDFNKGSLHEIYREIKEFSYIFEMLMHKEDINPELSMRIRKYIDRLEHLNHRLRMYK